MAVDLGLHVAYAERERLAQMLREARGESLSFVLVDVVALTPRERWLVPSLLAECVRTLRPGGLLLVHGHPSVLPEIGVALDQQLTFKYWIAVESAPIRSGYGLPSVHTAVLLFAKNGGRFHLKRVRAPHEICSYCKRPRKDWGGKAHLMHPDGCVLSDVWTHLAENDNRAGLSALVRDALLGLLDFPEVFTASDLSGATWEDGEWAAQQIVGIVGPTFPGPGLSIAGRGPDITPFLPVSAAERSPEATRRGEGTGGEVNPPDGAGGHAHPEWSRRAAGQTGGRRALPADLVDVVHHGDALEVLQRYPDESIDLAFADPPYNLDKDYGTYTDQQRRDRYVEWCNAWLAEYARVLKPTGSLYVLNLPHWALYHAAFLNKKLDFQSWVVWREMGEPRGKLLPAHYALLFFTKHPSDFTFNYDAVSPIDARSYCLRASCVRERKARGVDEKEPLTDFWWDIHRIRHPRDRDYHPCQLPEALMERIIRLSSNEGDVVLDALCGTGTTAVIAAQLGRRYVAVDVDEEYVRITRDKLAALAQHGYVPRLSTERPRPKYTKKQLQLELRALASRLGRLPTPEDVASMGKYDVRLFFDMFPTWGKALKAAKLEVPRE